MRLTVVKVLGNVLFGWDGYGAWREILVNEKVASRAAQSLCYTSSVMVTLPGEV